MFIYWRWWWNEIWLCGTGGNDTDGGNLKYWEKTFPIAPVSITNLVWIDVESNTGSRVHKHINTQYWKKAKRMKLEQIVHIVTILLWRRILCCLIFSSSVFYGKYWNKRAVLRSGHTERGLPQRTAVSVRCGMLHSKQTLLTIIFWKHSS